MKRFLIAALAALAFSAAPAQAQRAGPASSSGSDLSVHGIFAYYWGASGVGLGARYQLPIAPQGVLHAQVKDDIALDFGADFVHVDFGQFATDYVCTFSGCYYTYSDVSWNAIVPSVGILWDFWLTPQLAVYPKLESGFAIGWWSGNWYRGYGYAGPTANAFFLEGIAGAKFKLANGLAIKAELGSGMLKLGVAFPM